MEEENKQTLLKDSEIMIARIISHLAPNGIKSVTLEITSLELEGQNFDVSFFVDAIEWLSAEKIIRFSNSNSNPITGRYKKCNLTSYGFSLLGQKLVGAAGGETVGEAAKKISENNITYTRIGDFFGGLLGGFTKSISG